MIKRCVIGLSISICAVGITHLHSATIRHVTSTVMRDVRTGVRAGIEAGGNIGGYGVPVGAGIAWLFLNDHTQNHPCTCCFDRCKKYYTCVPCSQCAAPFCGERLEQYKNVGELSKAICSVPGAIIGGVVGAVVGPVDRLMAYIIHRRLPSSKEVPKHE